MKTTFDLPPDLIRELKLRAADEGRKLRDVAAELLRYGLERPKFSSRSVEKNRISRSPISGLPVIHPQGSPGFVPPTLKESLALIDQANQQEDLRRAGLAD